MGLNTTHDDQLLFRGARLFLLNDNSEWTDAYDVGDISLVISPVTPMHGGVKCTARIIGTTEEGATTTLRFPDYAAICGALTVGKRVQVVIYKSDSGEESPDPTPIITGRIWNTTRTNISYSDLLQNRLEVEVVSDWDFINMIPSGMLVKPTNKDINNLMSVSFMLRNKKLMNEKFKQHLQTMAKGTGIGGSGSINISKLAAAVIDNAEQNPENPVKKTTMQDSVVINNTPELLIPNDCVDSAIKNITRLCTDMFGRVSNKQIYLEVLKTFYQILVPTQVFVGDKNSGEWRPWAVPDNLWASVDDDQESAMFEPTDIISVIQGDTANTPGDFAGVAVRYTPSFGLNDMQRGISTSDVVIYMQKPNDKTGKLEQVTLTGVAKGGQVYATPKNDDSTKSSGGGIILDGDLIFKELPAWIGFVTPSTKRVGGSSGTDWREKWALMIARAEVAKHKGQSHTAIVNLTVNNLDAVLTDMTIGDIVSVNCTPKNIVEDGLKKGYSKKDNIYGRLIGIKFELHSTGERFQTSLSLTLQGVRTYEEQQALCIPNTTFFKEGY